MRLGLLGPSFEKLDALERAARFLLEEAAVERAIYLGVDRALDRVVSRWAEDLVGGDPAEAALWARAADRCSQATPAQIDQFLAAERERRSLAVFESLPDERTRVVELLNGKVCVMIYDKSRLDEEDMLPASFLVFGASRQPLVKQVGSRWFLSPGLLGHFGVMTLEDLDDGVHLALFDGVGREIRKERLLAGRVARLKVSGSDE